MRDKPMNVRPSSTILVDFASGATVPDNAPRDGPAAGGRTRCIVIGLVNDPGSRLALRWAHLTARLSSMMLVVVTAYQASHPVLTLNGYAYLHTDTCRQASEAMQRAVLRTELGAMNNPAAISCVVAEGHATDVLVAAADAELLVVGRRASRIRRLLTGSVSSGCVRRASCPVVIIRSGREWPVLAGVRVPNAENWN